MTTENNDQDVQLDEEIELEVEDVVEEDDSTEEDDVDLQEENERLKKELADRDEKLKKDRIKARKANKPKETEPSKTEDSITYKDSLLLAKADIHIDDVDEVIDYARYRGINIGTALKSNTIQAILKDRIEERNTANATSTKGGARGSSKVTSDTLINKAETKGELPDSHEELMRLARARRGIKD